MNTPPVPPPGPAAPSSPSGASGLVSLPSEIVRLPQELAARLLNGLRTVFVSGTVTGRGTDGALNVRSQFGEIAVRAGTAVPADRQVTLLIPPLSGRAATLTPPQLSRNPIPASLLLSKPPVPQPPSGAGSTPPSPTGSPGTAWQASAPKGAITTLPPAPAPTPGLGSATPAAVSAPAPQPSGTIPQPLLPAAGSPTPIAPQAPQANAPTGAPTAPNLAPPAPAGPTAAAPLAGATPTRSSPATPTGSVPGAPSASATSSPPPRPTTGPTPGPGAAPAGPLGRLALSAQLLTQSGGTPAAGTPATPNQPTGTPQLAPPQQPGVAPQGTAPQVAAPQGTTPQVPAAPAAGLAPSPSIVPPTAAGPAASIAATGARTAPSIPPAAGTLVDDVIPPESARRVPALREAVSVLSVANPALATQFVRSVLPQANTQLAATLLFFLSATRSGDVRGWMGDRVTSALDEAGRGDLIPKLSAELATPARALPDSPAGEWRSQTIPLYQDGDLGGMAVHVRRGGDEAGGGGDEEAAGHRFLIDLDFSRLGRLQFDGRVHETRFDLTVRSPAAFPEPVRQDMRILFRDASNAVGLHGGLTFQAGGHDWASVATARS